MFDLFRSRDKAVRILLGGLLLVVAFSMLSYLVPNYNNGAGTPDTVVAEVGGEKILLADVQRQEQLKKRVAELPRPLFKECRDLVLRKCAPQRQMEIRRIFEKEPFGELERLVTQKLLDVAQGVAREELRSEEWLRLMAQLSGRSGCGTGSPSIGQCSTCPSVRRR